MRLTDDYLDLFLWGRQPSWMVCSGDDDGGDDDGGGGDGGDDDGGSGAQGGGGGGDDDGGSGAQSGGGGGGDDGGSDASSGGTGPDGGGGDSGAGASDAGAGHEGDTGGGGGGTDSGAASGGGGGGTDSGGAGAADAGGGGAGADAGGTGGGGSDAGGGAPDGTGANDATGGNQDPGGGGTADTGGGPVDAGGVTGGDTGTTTAAGPADAGSAPSSAPSGTPGGLSSDAAAALESAPAGMGQVASASPAAAASAFGLGGGLGGIQGALGDLGQTPVGKALSDASNPSASAATTAQNSQNVAGDQNPVPGASPAQTGNQAIEAAQDRIAPGQQKLSGADQSGIPSQEPGFDQELDTIPGAFNSNSYQGQQGQQGPNAPDFMNSPSGVPGDMAQSPTDQAIAQAQAAMSGQQGMPGNMNMQLASNSPDITSLVDQPPAPLSDPSSLTTRASFTDPGALPGAPVDPTNPFADPSTTTPSIYPAGQPGGFITDPTTTFDTGIGAGSQFTTAPEGTVNAYNAGNPPGDFGFHVANADLSGSNYRDPSAYDTAAGPGPGNVASLGQPGGGVSGLGSPFGAGPSTNPTADAEAAAFNRPDASGSPSWANAANLNGAGQLGSFDSSVTTPVVSDPTPAVANQKDFNAIDAEAPPPSDVPAPATAPTPSPVLSSGPAPDVAGPIGPDIAPSGNPDVFSALNDPGSAGNSSSNAGEGGGAGGGNGGGGLLASQLVQPIPGNGPADGTSPAGGPPSDGSSPLVNPFFPNITLGDEGSPLGNFNPEEGLFSPAGRPGGAAPVDNISAFDALNNAG